MILWFDWIHSDLIVNINKETLYTSFSLLCRHYYHYYYYYFFGKKNNNSSNSSITSLSTFNIYITQIYEEIFTQINTIAN